MMKLIVAFRNFANVPKNQDKPRKDDSSVFLDTNRASLVDLSPGWETTYVGHYHSTLTGPEEVVCCKIMPIHTLFALQHVWHYNHNFALSDDNDEDDCSRQTQ